jgi:negative regulator of sigma-B (phosphoserine phosphatase)
MTAHGAGAVERRHACLALAVAAAPFPNERESGDRHVFHHCREGILIAAVDGAGHGAEAAAAARVAAATLEAHAHESPITLLLRCHEDLKGTRGAVVTTAFVHLRDRTLTWAGIGNVEAMLIHDGNNGAPPDRLLLRNGVLGYRLPSIRAEVLPLAPLDTLVIATDGIAPEFGDGLLLDDDPQVIADRLLADHYQGTDDALVVVARYLGGDCE